MNIIKAHWQYMLGGITGTICAYIAYRVWELATVKIIGLHVSCLSTPQTLYSLMALVGIATSIATFVYFIIHLVVWICTVK